MSQAKILINTKSLTLELEGHDDFVRTYLEKLLPIIERSSLQVDDGQGLSVKENAPSLPAESTPPPVPAIVVSEKPATRSKRKARGMSCREKLLSLRNDGFFKQNRTISEIQRELRSRGEDHLLSQVGAALSTMAKNDQIGRLSLDGRYNYFWEA